MNFFERMIRAASRETIPYFEGKKAVENARGKEILESIARELHFEKNDPTAYVIEPDVDGNHWQYYVALLWDVRKTEPEKYAFTDTESKVVKIYGLQNGTIDVSYEIPHEKHPACIRIFHVSQELAASAPSLPKPITEYTLEDMVRIAMERTAHGADFIRGEVNTKLWHSFMSRF